MLKQLLQFCLSFFIGSSALAQTPEELIQKWCKKFPDSTQFAIAVVQPSGVQYYGFEKVGQDYQAVENQNAVFEIGSISKVFTSTLLAQDIESGLLKRHTKVQRLLPFKLKKRPKITLEQLSNHSSGLPRLPDNIFPMLMQYADNPYHKYGPTELEYYCTKQLSLTSEVGTNFLYSNLGAGLLGYALSQKHEQSYEALLQNRIFKPLGMTQSTTKIAQVSEQLILGRDATGATVSNWDLNVLAPAGGIFSSVEDLVKFVNANFEPKQAALSLQRMPTFSISDKEKVGLGWQMLKQKSGNWIHWHNGGTGGYTSFMAIDRSKKHAVIILSNASALQKVARNVDRLGFAWLKQLTSEEEE